MIKLVVYTQIYSKFKYSASWLNQMTFVESIIVLQSKPYEINLNTKQTSMFLMLNENFVNVFVCSIKPRQMEHVAFHVLIKRFKSAFIDVTLPTLKRAWLIMIVILNLTKCHTQF